MYASEAQELQFDKEAEQKRKYIHDKHLSTRGNATKIWPGIRKYTDEELEEISQISYFTRNPEKLNKVRCEYPTYQRIFCMKPGWDMYMPRDDRRSIRTKRETLCKEEQERIIPVLTSSLYGKSYMGPLDNMIREFSRKMQIPEFYRMNGVGVPPLRKE